ncbi:5-formyltetrahydrofolate cyclo-ligase [Microbaculum marinum]|uniref:5-formyltetrahydrofolate cyclo-ligase n=1 Tax=Microbaculum marinum TaxID=1764581 RepID=A0AAW9RDR6_9HYPH
MHEIEPGYSGLPVSDPKQQELDVSRWRKAERSRQIASRLALPSEQRRVHGKRIAGHLKKLIGDAAEQVVSAYWPFRGEPDLRSLMTALAFDGARTALPVVIERGRPLVFRLWKTGDRLEKGVWNIPVPADGAVVVPDVVIAPVVGFDRENYRLGYGGGFFDRTLAATTKRPRVFGVGYSSAFMPTIYPQAHDIPMDAIITEQGEMRFDVGV